MLTLFPQGSVGVSQYQELHREASETTPLMETSYHDYSGWVGVWEGHAREREVVYVCVCVLEVIYHAPSIIPFVMFDDE